MSSQITTDTDTLIEEIAARCRTRQEDIDSLIRLQSAKISRNKPFVISFVGRFKTGKSSLINALIGRPLLPTRATTATMVVTKIVKGAEDAAWLVEDGIKTKVSFEQAKDIILNYKTEDAENTVEIIFELSDINIGENIEIRDTPGMSDSAQNGVLEDVALRSLCDTDFAVIVYDATSFITARERQLTTSILKLLGNNVTFVVNRINQLNSRKNLNLVKEQAETCFGRYGENCGLYFVAILPDKAFFDCFDKWFFETVSCGDRSVLDNLRSDHVKAKKHSGIRKLLPGIVADLQEAKEAEITIRFLHDRAYQKAETKALSSKRDRAIAIESDAPRVSDLLADTSGLESYLTAQLKEASGDYTDNSRRTVAEFFKTKYSEICRTYRSFSVSDSSFIDTALEGLTFPGIMYRKKHSMLKKAAIGMLVGTLARYMFGPYGPNVGKKAMASLEDDVEDISVPTTVDFVENNVVPRVLAEFENLRIRMTKSIDSESVGITTGYESSLDGLEKITEQLRSQITALRDMEKNDVMQ